jgi:hypothetical protein
MAGDPKVEEVIRHRQEYARQLGYGSRAIPADLLRRAVERKEQLVSFQPKPARKRRTAWGRELTG